MPWVPAVHTGNLEKQCVNSYKNSGTKPTSVTGSDADGRGAVPRTGARAARCEGAASCTPLALPRSRPRVRRAWTGRRGLRRGRRAAPRGDSPWTRQPLDAPGAARPSPRLREGLCADAALRATFMLSRSQRSGDREPCQDQRARGSFARQKRRVSVCGSACGPLGDSRSRSSGLAGSPGNCDPAPDSCWDTPDSCSCQPRPAPCRRLRTWKVNSCRSVVLRVLCLWLVTFVWAVDKTIVIWLPEWHWLSILFYSVLLNARLVL